MKTILSRILAVGGIAAVCAASAPGAFAQDYGGRYHGPRRFHMRQTQQQIAMLQAAYAHDVAVGDFAAAAQDHRRAQALRARLRASQDGFGNGGYGYRDNRSFPQDGGY